MPTVLIVEDEERLLGNVVRFLRSQPGEMRVLTATSGESGLRWINTDPSIAVLVTDICLPGIDGLEVVRRAGRMRPELPLLVATGHGTEAVRRVALANGVSCFLAKPIDLDELRDAILNAVAGGREEVPEASESGLEAAVRILTERRVTDVLCYRSERDSGYLVLVDGVLMACGTESREGTEAFAAMAAWPHGRLHRLRSWGLSMYPRNVDLPT